MFTNLKTLVKDEHNARRNDYSFYITNGYFPTWAEEHHNNSDAGIEAYCTPAKWVAYKDGRITREKAIEAAIKRAYKEIEKREAEAIAEIEAAENAPDLIYCNISVEWHKNNYWGMNPHAATVSNNGGYHGKASGCGYDKLSAAIASALNQDKSIKRMLYIAAEQAIEDGNAPIRTANGCYIYRDSIGYGSGYNVLPYFEGGVGVSCFASIFEKCGYIFKAHSSPKHFDFYTIYRKEV